MLQSPSSSRISTSSWILKRAWLCAAVVVLALLLLGNLPLVLGKQYPQWDAAGLFGPQFSLVADHVKANRLLLWNPWVGAGSPDFAEPEYGTTSPLLLICAILSSSPLAGFVCYWLVLWVFGGIGLLMLLRHLEIPTWGALIATLGFVTSGFYTGHAEHTSSICSISFVPWILWRLDCAIQRRSYWCAVQSGAMYGLSALGGYPEFTILTPIFLGLWVLGRTLWPLTDYSGPKENIASRLRRSFLSLVLVGCVGALILSPSYTGFLSSTAGYSDRVGPRSRLEATTSNILPVEAVSTLSSPYLYLLNMEPNHIWPKTDLSMSSVYCGVVVLAFAAFGLVKKSGWRYWLVLIGLFFLCCAFGDRLPVRGWLYDYFPPTRYFRNPSLFRFYVILIITVLAGLGTRDLQLAQVLRKRAILPWAIWLALGAVACFSFWLVVLPVHTFPQGKSLALIHLMLMWFGIPALALLAQKTAASPRLLSGILLAAAAGDSLTTLYIARPTLYTDANRSWWMTVDTRHVQSLDLTSNGLLRQLDPPPELATFQNNRNSVLKIPTLQGYLTMSNRYHAQMAVDPTLSYMALGKSRFWFSAQAIETLPDVASFTLFGEDVRKNGRPVIFLHSPQQMRELSHYEQAPPLTVLDQSQSGRAAAAASAVTVSELSYRPNWLSFKYRAPSAGWLLVTDRWAPDWELTVNGRPRKLYGADFVFRAVPVESGTNDILFRYRPHLFFWFLGISWGTLLLLSSAELWRRYSKMTRNTEAYAKVIG
ncbi:MAG: hypothetical protein JWP08_4446 [Bryobacterales bacterium]|nr:hypothetical protein [Bryobacterales bacterium]